MVARCAYGVQQHQSALSTKRRLDAVEENDGDRRYLTRAVGSREVRATQRPTLGDEAVEAPVETCWRSGDTGSWRRLTPAWIEREMLGGTTDKAER
jgi:hypothetical protein